MRRIYIFLLIFILFTIGIVVGLNITGYLFNNQRIIPPSSHIEWKYLEVNNSMGYSNDSNNTIYYFPIILNLTEKMKDIPGIENINYEIFLSNDTIQQIIEYYKDILKTEGYGYHDEYSGIKTYDYNEIQYYTFIKGFNCVIIYLSSYNQQTWICYSTSDILHYKEIYNYMVNHGII